jgi:hypothetical protein
MTGGRKKFDATYPSVDGVENYHSSEGVHHETRNSVITNFLETKRH